MRSDEGGEKGKERERGNVRPILIFPCKFHKVPVYFRLHDHSPASARGIQKPHRQPAYRPPYICGRRPLPLHSSS